MEPNEHNDGSSSSMKKIFFHKKKISFQKKGIFIQKKIFQGQKCDTCHAGDTPSGGLDLSPAVAWQNLHDVASEINGDKLVAPGSARASVLCLALASLFRTFSCILCCIKLCCSGSATLALWSYAPGCACPRRQQLAPRLQPL